MWIQLDPVLGAVKIGANPDLGAISLMTNFLLNKTSQNRSQMNILAI